MRLAVLVAVVMVAVPVASRATVVTFQNDHAGFVAAAGSLSRIDFETLPDGSPSYTGAPITADFNYDAQGMHFTSPIPELTISSTAPDFVLAAVAYNRHRNWIRADPTMPTTAVGIFSPGGTTLRAFDAAGGLLGQVSYYSSGGDFFLGIVSTDAIAYATIDRGSFAEWVESIEFHSVPEPATAACLAAAAAVAWRKRRPASPPSDLGLRTARTPGGG